MIVARSVTAVRRIDKIIIAHRKENVNRFFGILYLLSILFDCDFSQNATFAFLRVDFPTRRQQNFLNIHRELTPLLAKYDIITIVMM